VRANTGCQQLLITPLRRPQWRWPGAGGGEHQQAPDPCCSPSGQSAQLRKIAEGAACSFHRLVDEHVEAFRAVAPLSSGWRAGCRWAIRQGQRPRGRHKQIAFSVPPEASPPSPPSVARSCPHRNHRHHRRQAPHRAWCPRRCSSSWPISAVFKTSQRLQRQQPRSAPATALALCGKRREAWSLPVLPL